MGSRGRLTSLRRGNRSSVSRRQNARLEVHTIGSPGIATRRGGKKLAGKAGFCRNTAGRPARSADFASAIYRPKPSATMISSRGRGHGIQKGSQPPISKIPNPTLYRLTRRQWLGFDQIGLGIAKVLAHKRRRLQGADRTGGRGVRALAHHH